MGIDASKIVRVRYGDVDSNARECESSNVKPYTRQCTTLIIRPTYRHRNRSDSCLRWRCSPARQCTDGLDCQHAKSRPPIRMQDTSTERTPTQTYTSALCDPITLGLAGIKQSRRRIILLRFRFPGDGASKLVARHTTVTKDSGCVTTYKVV